VPDWRKKLRKTKQEDSNSTTSSITKTIPEKRKSVAKVSSDWRKELKAKKDRKAKKELEANEARGPEFRLVQKPAQEPESTSPLPQPKPVLRPNKVDPSSSWKKRNTATAAAAAVANKAPISPRSTFGKAKTGRMRDTTSDRDGVPAWRKNLKKIHKAKTTAKQVLIQAPTSAVPGPKQRSAVLLNKSKVEKLKPTLKSRKAKPQTSKTSNVPAWRQKLKKAPNHKAPKAAASKATTPSAVFAGPKIVVHRANASKASKASDDDSNSDWDCDDDDSAPVALPVSYSRRAAAIKAVKTSVSSSAAGAKPVSRALNKPKPKPTVVVKPENRRAPVTKRASLGGKSSRNADALARILGGLGDYYASYEGAIREEGYATMEELRGLEVSELVEMGVKKGHAKRIMRAIFEA